MAAVTTVATLTTVAAVTTVATVTTTMTTTTVAAGATAVGNTAAAVAGHRGRITTHEGDGHQAEKQGNRESKETLHHFPPGSGKGVTTTPRHSRTHVASVGRREKNRIRDGHRTAAHTTIQATLGRGRAAVGTSLRVLTAVKPFRLGKLGR